MDDQIPPPYEETPTQAEDEGVRRSWSQSYAVTTQGPTMDKSSEPQTSASAVVESNIAATAARSIGAEPTDQSTDVASHNAVLTIQDEIPQRGLTRMASSDTVTDLSLAKEPVHRSKSPFPSSYSVSHLDHTLGAVDGAQQETSVIPESFNSALEKGLLQLESNDPSELPKQEESEPGVEDEIYPDESVSEVDASEAKSDVPEPSMSPRSDLGILTPSFDTRSEVSVASHKPLAPSSPRLDPEEPLPVVPQTPLLVIPPPAALPISVQGSSDSDLLTPLPVSVHSSLAQSDAKEEDEERGLLVDTDADETIRHEVMFHARVFL